MSHLPACWGVHSKFPRLPHRVSARPTGARGVGSASRGRARLVDRLFTPLGTRRVFMDAWSAIGTFAVAEARALFVLFCETSTELVVPKRTPELDKICARTAARRTECPKTCSRLHGGQAAYLFECSISCTARRAGAPLLTASPRAQPLSFGSGAIKARRALGTYSRESLGVVNGGVALRLGVSLPHQRSLQVRIRSLAQRAQRRSHGKG